MSGLNLKNEHKSGFSLVALVVKVLLIVVVADLAIHLYSSIIGGGVDFPGVMRTVIRSLIVAVGVYLFFGRGKSLHDKESAETGEIAAGAVPGTDEDDINGWPNIDSLTRTSNERGLTVSILELMALADRYGHKLSIGLVRVDGLDSLKQSVADEAMIDMAGLMTESLRMPDRIGRFKDNVFMVLLPESDINGAAVVADRLRANLDEGENEEYTGKLSVWIGMTEFQRGEDLQSLLDRVEAATVQSQNEENGVFVKQT